MCLVSLRAATHLIGRQFAADRGFCNEGIIKGLNVWFLSVNETFNSYLINTFITHKLGLQSSDPNESLEALNMNNIYLQFDHSDFRIKDY